MFFFQENTLSFKMVLLKNPYQVFDYDDLQESLFERKEADCILSSEDGIEIDIHKEILFQTKFMQSILLNIENSCMLGVRETIFWTSNFKLWQPLELQRCIVSYLKVLMKDQ